MELFVHDANIYVDSTVIRIDGNRPYKVNDSLVLGQDWTVKQLDLEIQNLKKSLHLLSDGKGRWFNEKGEEIYPLRGAADLDLSCTPFTNSLPINRLPWQRNDARDLEMVFLSVPDLAWKKVKQRYLLLEKAAGRRKFHYKSGNFETNIEVDADGFVLRYLGIFTRVFSSGVITAESFFHGRKPSIRSRSPRSAPRNRARRSRTRRISRFPILIV